MDTNEPQEITEDQFYYYLEVLPPQFMNHAVKLLNGETIHASFGFCEGYDRIQAYWRKGGKFYTAPTVLHTDIYGDFRGFPKGA